MDNAVTVKTKKDFLKVWETLPTPRQCFIDLNGVARVWSGDQNRFGDLPGRSFGFDHTLFFLKE